MKRNLVATSLVLVGLLASVLNCAGKPKPPAQPAAAAASESRLAAPVMDFGLNLVREMRKGEAKKNIFISPVSVSAALSMAAAGAAGATRTEMVEALRCQNLNAEALNEAWKSSLLDVTGGADAPIVSIANSLWCDKTFSPRPEYVTLLGRWYDAPMQELDFKSSASADAVNAWVNKRTANKIPTIVNPSIMANSIMLLVNAVYFKGQWLTRFEEAASRPGEFTPASGSKQPVTMMTRGGKMPYAKADGWQAVRLDYRGERFSLYVLLPPKTAALAEWPKGWDSRKLRSIMDRMQPCEGNLVMPRFKLETDETLNQVLKALGMKKAFAASADFSGISRGIFISLVKHKTFVEVNEEGTEAAAATVVAFTKSAAAPQERFSMVVDRPFVVVLQDQKTGLPLFLGVINQL